MFGFNLPPSPFIQSVLDDMASDNIFSVSSYYVSGPNWRFSYGKLQRRGKPVPITWRERRLLLKAQKYLAKIRKLEEARELRGLRD